MTVHYSNSKIRPSYHKDAASVKNNPTEYITTLYNEDGKAISTISTNHILRVDKGDTRYSGQIKFIPFVRI